MDTDIRRNIQKAAAKLFLKYGLRSVSIDDICNELHISKKTFYSYFSQKEELIESVLLEHDEKKFGKQMERSKKFIVEGNRIDQIIAFSSFHFFNTNNQFVNFFFDLSKYYPEIHKKHTQRNHGMTCDQIKENIKKGIEEGIFRDDVNIDMMASFISIQFLTIINISQNDKTIGKPQETFEFLTDIYIRLLCNQKGLDYYLSLKSADNALKKGKEPTPFGDEEIELLIDQYLNSADEVIQSTFINK
jgi:AcrR family transcriptional regulator